MNPKRVISAVAVLAFSAAVAGIVFGQQKPPPDNKPASADMFTASSNKGIQAAFDEAIQMAMKAHAGVSDAMIEWELVKITGRQGGIAGFNETSVTIRVTSGTPPLPPRGG